MCGLTSFLLVFPGTALDAAWRLKPSAREELLPMGMVAVMTMLATGVACALAAIGLARRKEWGRRIAIAVLAINLLGDTANALIRHDWRTLIGLPIGGVMIAYLFGIAVRQWIYAPRLTNRGQAIARSEGP